MAIILPILLVKMIYYVDLLSLVNLKYDYPLKFILLNILTIYQVYLVFIILHLSSITFKKCPVNLQNDLIILIL
jgi:hypothetical protein